MGGRDLDLVKALQLLAAAPAAGKSAGIVVNLQGNRSVAKKSGYVIIDLRDQPCAQTKARF
jgi:hypothetical protein